MNDAIPKDLNKLRDDPNPAVRTLAQSLTTPQQFDLPDWKRDAPKPTRTTLTIKDQRESLPIFKLRTDLIKAIFDNRILVVIGETGSGKTTQMP
jgi:ATP-dependent RNA helicase DHX8/PRP22